MSTNLGEPQQIEAASVFLVVISPASLGSDFVFPELLHAVAVRKHLVPILSGIMYSELEAVKPRWVTALGFAVAVEWTGEPAAFTALLRGLVALAGEKQAPLTSAAERYEIPAPAVVPSRAVSLEGATAQVTPQPPALDVLGALMHLRDHTKFLWEELCMLQPYRVDGDADMKRTTMDKVRPALDFLVTAGHLRYQTEEAYKTITSGEQVLRIRVCDVTVQLMNLAKSLNNSRTRQAEPGAAPDPARDVGFADS